MEEEKAAAYYDDLSRKGGGAARFKQGLGFSPASSSNDAVPSRGSAIPSASSFLSNFVRASSPSKNEELERKSQLQSIQNKLKKKPKEDEKSVSSSSRVSKDRDDDKRSCRHSRGTLSHERRSRSRERHSKHRSPSRSKDRVRDGYSRRRSRSRSSNRRYRSRSTSSDRGRERRRRRRRSRSGSDEDRDKRKKNRDGKVRNSGVDYATVIEGYDRMTPAERVKAKMKLQLSETAEKDEAKGMGAGWERFYFNKDASLEDEEIEAAEDDVALVKQIGQTFRFSAMEARREEQIKAAHDEAIFGSSCHPLQNNTGFGTSSHPPVTVEEMETKNVETSTPQTDDSLTDLISDQVMAMQQVSWRDRTRRS